MQPSMNLKIDYQKACKGIHIMNEWTRGHQDDSRKRNSIKDLQNMQLSNLVTMNTWCGRKANEAKKTCITHEYEDVYPNEKWPLFTTMPTVKKNHGTTQYSDHRKTT